MIRIERLIPWCLTPVLFAFGTGCTPVPTTQRGPATDPAVTAETKASTSTAKRFQDTPLKGRTAVESAIELSEKYARLSDQTIALREENQRLVTENESLLQQITTLEARLRQTQKELGEANDLLIDMLTELNNWKTSILGFRGEMREAAKAQLEALLKVLEILGGEAEAGSLQQQHAGTLNPGASATPEANEPTMSASGEPNVP
jgi:chromosome segregation ATPase